MKGVSAEPKKKPGAAGFLVLFAIPWTLRMPVGPRGSTPPNSSGNHSDFDLESKKRRSKTEKTAMGSLCLEEGRRLAGDREHSAAELRASKIGTLTAYGLYPAAAGAKSIASKPKQPFVSLRTLAYVDAPSKSVSTIGLTSLNDATLQI